MNKFYVTTAIAYVNAPPHIGFALELLYADVLARFHRQKGDETFFLTGTDEHGTKIVRTASDQGKSPQELVDENAPHFSKLAEVLNCSNDDFIRTSDRDRHWPGVEELWLRLVDADAIYKDTYEGYYCVGCEAYVAENDLIDGKCTTHETIPEEIQEDNYFFRLSRYQDEIKKLIENEELNVVPKARRNELLSLIDREGLKDVSFSRPKEKLPWGVPVPGDEEHVIYVWADALPNYITGVGYGRDDEMFSKWWPVDVHVIGKDILRFHAAIWPAMLLAAKLDVPKTIFSHGFITSEGEKMSKSKGNVVDPFKVVERYGVDAVRHYLLREISSWEDGDYSEERFRDRYNADLANGIGNLTSRIIALSTKNNITISSTGKKLNEARDLIKKAMDAFRFHDALSVIWKEIASVDGFLEERKPWELAKDNDNKKELEEVLGLALWRLSEIADLLKPFLPGTSERILTAINDGALSEPLFPRLE